MLSCGFWRLKPCGLKNKGKQQVNEQRQDGLILSTSVLKGRLLPNRRSVRIAARQTLPSSMLTLKDDALTKSAESATKRLASSVGTQDLGWIGGPLGAINTGSPRNTYLSCMPSRKENVQSAGKSQRQLVGCTLTIATNQEQFGVCYATAATQESGRSKKTPKHSSKQSVI